MSYPTTTNLRENVSHIKTMTNNSSDFQVKYGEIGGHNAAFVLCDGMYDVVQMAELVYNPLSKIKPEKNVTKIYETMTSKSLCAVSQNCTEDIDEIIYLCISGFCVVLLEGCTKALAIGVQGFKARGVEKPDSGKDLRASKESFTETIRTNITLIRRRLKTPELVFEMFQGGDVSRTDIALCYLKGRADGELIEEVRNKLKSIDFDTVFEGGYIQTFLEEKTNITFSQVGITERPDDLAAKMFEGRIGIIVDGTPYVIYLPKLFIENFQTMDDYTGNSIYAFFTRTLKFFAFVLSILLPGFYIAAANFRPEILPNSLLFNLELSAGKTPYPILVECILMHLLYDIMREAGLRIPNYIGHVVSIVGGLVIGQILVSANLVSAPVILIVAITSLSSFVVPDLYDSILIYRYGVMLMGGLWGFFGIDIFIIMSLVKIFSMTSYGYPFSAPLIPFKLKGMRDVFGRQNWRKMSKGFFNISELKNKE